MAALDRLSVPSAIGLLLVTAAVAIGPPLYANTEKLELVPTKHLVLPGEQGAEVAVFHRVGDEDRPPATLAAIEMGDGSRARLLAQFDPASGVAVQRLEDLSTGWYAEWRLETGIRNLAEIGAVGDGSAGDWVRHAQERTEEESTGRTLYLETADGAFVTWFEPTASKTAADDARVEGMAEFTRQLAEHRPPGPAIRAVRLLAPLTSRRAAGGLSHFETLITALQDSMAVSGLDVDSTTEDDPTARILPLSERRDRIDSLRKDLEGYEAATSEVQPADSRQ